MPLPRRRLKQLATTAGFALCALGTASAFGPPTGATRLRVAPRVSPLRPSKPTLVALHRPTTPGRASPLPLPQQRRPRQQLVSLRAAEEAAADESGEEAAKSAVEEVDEKNASVAKVGMSFVLLVVADHALKIGLKNVPFPASLAGMIALWTSLLALDSISPNASAAVMRWIAPGAALLAAWLPLFFAPSLVALPMSTFRPQGAELVKLIVIVVGGFFASLAGTALFASKLVSGDGEKKLGDVSFPLGSGPAMGRSDRGEAAARAAAANVPLPSASWAIPASAALTIVGAVKVWLAAAAKAQKGHCMDPLNLGAAGTLLTGATFLGYTSGIALKSPLLHPVLLTAAATVAAAAVAGAALGGSAAGVIGASYFGSKGATGSLLLMLLGPAVLSFAVPMFSRRRLMKKELAACTLAPLAGAAGGLFGTALLARILALPAATAIATLPRQLTSPLALACAGILGADPSAAVTLVVVTGLIGANIGAKVLDALKVKDPTARGLAMGTAAHGLGTAALASTESAAFPFAAVSMALTGTFSTVMVAIPALKRALIGLATGN